MAKEKYSWQNGTSEYAKKIGIESWNLQLYPCEDELVINVYNQEFTPPRCFKEVNRVDLGNKIQYDKEWLEQLPTKDAEICIRGNNGLDYSIIISACFCNGTLNTSNDEICSDPNQFIKRAKEYFKQFGKEKDGKARLKNALTSPELPQRQKKAIRSLIEAL